MPFPHHRPPPAPTGFWGRPTVPGGTVLGLPTLLPVAVRLARDAPAPGIGGAFPRAGITIDPGCPDRYCYVLSIDIYGPLGQPLSHQYVRFATDRQIIGADQMGRVVAALVAPVASMQGAGRDTLPGAGAVDLYRSDIATARYEVTIISVTRRD